MNFGSKISVKKLKRLTRYFVAMSNFKICGPRPRVALSLHFILAYNNAAGYIGLRVYIICIYNQQEYIFLYFCGAYQSLQVFYFDLCKSIKSFVYNVTIKSPRIRFQVFIAIKYRRNATCNEMDRANKEIIDFYQFIEFIVCIPLSCHYFHGGMHFS